MEEEDVVNGGEDLPPSRCQIDYTTAGFLVSIFNIGASVLLTATVYVVCGHLWYKFFTIMADRMAVSASDVKLMQSISRCNGAYYVVIWFTVALIIWLICRRMGARARLYVNALVAFGLCAAFIGFAILNLHYIFMHIELIPKH